MATTLSTPNTATISLDAFGSITISSGATGTIAFTSIDEGIKSSFIEKIQNRTYGPYGVPMTVVITPTSGSLSYTLNNNINANYSLDANGNVIGLQNINFDTLIGQSGIPCIIPGGTGITLSAAGALSGIATLPTTYGWCWVHLPTTALASGTGGMYLANLTSATGGTVYQNKYAQYDGSPTIPTALGVLVGNNTPVSQAITPLTLFSKKIAANAMGLNGAIKTIEKWAFGGTLGTKDCVIQSSDANMYVSVQAAAATVGNVELARSVHNRGVANKQLQTRFNSAGVATGLTASSSFYGALNTAVDWELNLRGQLANASDFIVLEGYSITLSNFT